MGEALRFLDSHRDDDPDAPRLAESLAFFLVARCESSHAGWRVLRQVIVDSAADAPWEKCARRAVPLVKSDLLDVDEETGRTPLSRAQHFAAQRRAQTIARHVDQRAVLKDLGLKDIGPVSPERWQAALVNAVTSRSREQVSRTIQQSLLG